MLFRSALVFFQTSNSLVCLKMRIIIGAPGVEPISASRLIVVCLSGCWARIELVLGKIPPQALSMNAATRTATTPTILENGKRIDNSARNNLSAIPTRGMVTAPSPAGKTTGL